uniref:Setae polypeptide n=1 Tax=Ochrogaster lunifer TaxID=319761 RepID=A0AA49ETQ1_OCHLU|nr:setae polypeptide [Ochrogaster lunifer]
MYLFLTLFAFIIHVPSPILGSTLKQHDQSCSMNEITCSDGSCVSISSLCDGFTDCPDGLDESACNNLASSTSDLLIGYNEKSRVKRQTGSEAINAGACVLPPYPKHGTYTVTNAPLAAPGQALAAARLNVSCYQGYVAIDSNIFCVDGIWSGSTPKCERFCELNPHPSVQYHCLVTDAVEGQRRCNQYEPSGTIVRPECNAPNYYSTYTLPLMRCINGRWNEVFTCIPECGTVTPEGEIPVLGGRRAKKGELPWHAGIYRKTTTPYSQICGGSLVSTTVVISAAHCFWSDVDKKLPAKNYAVAVGKLYRPWNDKQDVDAQKSDVSEIHFPLRFHGGATNFQEDIAIVILASTIEYKTYVQPVCLNFEYNFERRQLVEGKMGKVAGWGLTAENGVASPVLKVTELPYVEIGRCFDSLPPGFKEYITSDKICAGYNNNGTPLCKGDGGGGLVFPKYDQGVERYYLRGIVSTAPNNENLCNANTLTTFTRVRMHEDFIKMYL